jgi:hypothetical protein
MATQLRDNQERQCCGQPQRHQAQKAGPSASSARSRRDLLRHRDRDCDRPLAARRKKDDQAAGQRAQQNYGRYRDSQISLPPRTAVSSAAIRCSNWVQAVLHRPIGLALSALEAGSAAGGQDAAAGR